MSKSNNFQRIKVVLGLVVVLAVGILIGRSGREGDGTEFVGKPELGARIGGGEGEGEDVEAEPGHRENKPEQDESEGGETVETPAPKATRSAKVARVLDGDTIEIEDGECPEGQYAVWSNTGDQAFLYDASGNLVAEYQY